MYGETLIYQEDHFIYLVWFAAFYIIGFPFTVKTYNFKTLNMPCCIKQTFNFINPNDAFNQ